MTNQSLVQVPLAENLLSNLFCEFCPHLCIIWRISISERVICSEYYCTLWKTADMMKPYCRRGSQSGCGNSSPDIFNQRQLESVLVYMTLCLPFTSLEDDWSSQSISNKFVSEYFRETTMH